MKRHPEVWFLALGVVVTMLLVSVVARAQENPEGAPPPFHPRIVGDLRAMFLFRSDTNYFQHAETFHFPASSTAAGVALTGGVELLPRLDLLASGHYVIGGADRADAHLRLTSGALLGLVRWSFLRLGGTGRDARFDVATSLGFGRYFLQETYLDPALSPHTFKQSDASYGGQLGLEVALHVDVFRAVLGYAAHVAPASISDRIGGTVYAGGHELSFGVGVRL